MAHIGTLESRTERVPACAAISGHQESIRVKCQYHQGVIGIFAVDGDIQHVLMMEAIICGDECRAAVIADLHAFAFRSQNHALRIFGIDHNRVYNPVSRSSTFPFPAFVARLPESAGGASVQSVRMLRILLDQLRAAKNEWYTGVTLPVLSGINAVINAGARRSMHVGRIRWVDNNTHHV